MLANLIFMSVAIPYLASATSSGQVITNSSGEACQLLNGFGSANVINSSCSSCKGVYAACRQVLVDELQSSSVGAESSDGSNSTSSEVRPPSKSEAYGYGFLLSVAVSGTSLLSLVLVPCLKPGAKLFFLYKPINALMMGSASFALLSDAVLHILPEIYASNEDTVDPHLHLWRACLIPAAVYVFFVLEFFLHALQSKSISSHGHSHEHADSKGAKSGASKDHQPSPPPQSIETVSHPGSTELQDKDTMLSQSTSSGPEVEVHKASCCNLRQIKPLAWLLITGDSIHNFTDGVALGVAISASLSLGISTAIALVLHEIPHELADFAILISTGMKWYTAFLLNFLHSLAAMVGFFVGVAIGTNSETAVDWILTATLGIFLYISLVDLLPSIVHNTEKGYMLAVIFIMVNIGFVISFVSLLLIAIYEDELNQIIH